MEGGPRRSGREFSGLAMEREALEVELLEPSEKVAACPHNLTSTRDSGEQATTHFSIAGSATNKKLVAHSNCCPNLDVESIPTVQ